MSASQRRRTFLSSLGVSTLRRQAFAVIAGGSALSFAPRAAHADISSWMYAGGGVALVDATKNDTFGALAVDAGLGTPATSPVVVGTVFHTAGQFGYGLDLGGALRLTTAGYSRGNYGLGLDLGPEYHFGDNKAVQGAARLLLGAPWGITAAASGTYSAEDVRTFMFTLGFDFARLTVHRETGLNWFPNPSRSPEGDAFR